MLSLLVEEQDFFVYNYHHPEKHPDAPRLLYKIVHFLRVILTFLNVLFFTFVRGIGLLVCVFLPPNEQGHLSQPQTDSLSSRSCIIWFSLKCSLS